MFQLLNNISPSIPRNRGFNSVETLTTRADYLLIDLVFTQRSSGISIKKVVERVINQKETRHVFGTYIDLARWTLAIHLSHMMNGANAESLVQFCTDKIVLENEGSHLPVCHHHAFSSYLQIFMGAKTHPPLERDRFRHFLVNWFCCRILQFSVTAAT